MRRKLLRSADLKNNYAFFPGTGIVSKRVKHDWRGYHKIDSRHEIIWLKFEIVEHLNSDH
jgi:hypothetical protein